MPTNDQETPRKEEQRIKFWLDEINAAKKREKDYRTNGQRILEIYDGTKHETVPFNILFSNTETMLPALYSTTPRPVVQRRFKDEDPLGQHAAMAGERCLEFLLDTDAREYESFTEGMKYVTLDALLPGRGWASVKYDAELNEYPSQDGEEAASYTEGETICIESRQWERVYHGYAKRWHHVPWIAYEEYLDRDEAKEKFGKAIANKLHYTDTEEQETDKDAPRQKEERSKGERKLACVYQVWDKENWGGEGERKILWVAPTYKDGYLRVDDDELELSGFFNCPKPMQFIDKSHTLTPTALYLIYENQATELNKIQRRINNLVEACKARGLYDGELSGDLSKLFSESDNALIPTDRGASLSAEKGLDNAIWFMPVDQIRQVLMDLYNAREQCKQVIYEITGISDILRGSSKASETLGAQEIKTQWGTLRLKNKQKEVARFAVDLLCMMLELAASKFSEETWAKMTGLPFTTQAQVEQAKMLVMAAQANGMEPDPQAMALLQQPTWQQVLGLLKNDLARSYRIDIETNSTVEPEAAEDQKQIQELLMAMGQYLQGVGPLVQSGVMPFQAAQAMMLTIARRFRFGSKVEDYLKQMQPPKPEDNGNGAEQVKAEQEKLKQQEAMAKERLNMEFEKKSMQHEMEVMKVEKSLLEQKLDLEIEKIKQDFAAKQLQMGEQLAMDKIGTRDQLHQVKTSADDKVRSIRDQSAKQQGNVVQQAAGQLTSSSQAIQQTVKQVQQLSTALQSIQEQAQQTQQLLGELLKTSKAKRIKKAIRGQDGRIEAVEESVAM